MRRTAPPTLAAWAALAALLLAGAWSAHGDERATAIARASAALENGAAGSGLTVSATLYESGDGAWVDVLVPLEIISLHNPAFRVALVLPSLDGGPRVIEHREGPLERGSARGWMLRHALDLSTEFVDLAVVVEEETTGAWGAVVAELASTPRAYGPEVIVRRVEPKTAVPAAAAGEEATERSIRILPPRNQPVTGTVRLQILAVDPVVESVRVRLDDGSEVVDDSAPFSVVLDFGDAPRPREVVARAFAAGGVELGGDRITVNAGGAGVSVRIVRLEGSPDAGRVELEAEVEAPPGLAPERLEIWLDERRVATLERPPYRVELNTGAATEQSFVRVVALLPDGSSQEDAQLLYAPTERVEVNLVELFVVATDRQGQPLAELGSDDFEVRLGRERLAIDRFGPADEQPLALGLVVDTSQSMEALMAATIQAGAKFLTETLTEGDRAFLVDFDTRPRLAHPMTSEVTELLLSFGGLRPNGFTALYDAVIFSMLQFEAEVARRALVMLTDGDDYKSRFGQRRAIQYGRELGIPVYIIGLAGIYNPRGSLPKMDLEGLTEATGGRIFYISELGELDDVYARINRELRSQYLLAVSTDRPLTAAELGDLEVRSRRRGIQVRAVVGRGGEMEP